MAHPAVLWYEGWCCWACWARYENKGRGHHRHAKDVCSAIRFDASEAVKAQMIEKKYGRVWEGHVEVVCESWQNVDQHGTEASLTPSNRCQVCSCDEAARKSRGGYLQLSVHDVVDVQYYGSVEKGDDGWLYGWLSGCSATCGRVCGWFPAANVICGVAVGTVVCFAATDYQYV